MSGSQDQLVETLHQLAEEMEPNLSRSLDGVNDNGLGELREIYDDLCHTAGEPVYLSDGVYLDSDGNLFE